MESMKILINSLQKSGHNKLAQVLLMSTLLSIRLKSKCEQHRIYSKVNIIT